MHLTFTSQVKSKTRLESRSHRYQVECLDVSVVAADELELVERLEKIRTHIAIFDHKGGLELLANYGHEIGELTRDDAYDTQNGGIRVDLPNGSPGSMYVSLLSGEIITACGMTT